MAKSVVFDEIHITIRVPNELPENQSEELHRILTGAAFKRRLRHAVRAVFQASPELADVRVSLNR